MRVPISLALAALLAAPPARAEQAIPHLRKQGTATQLIGTGSRS
jgi:hypothetical protein